MPEVHPHDTAWLSKQVDGIPEHFKQEIMADYLNKPTRREANLGVLAERKAIAAILHNHDPHQHINIDYRDCTVSAKIHSRQCLCLQLQYHSMPLCGLYKLTVNYIKAQGLEPHPLPTKTLTAVEEGLLTESDTVKVNGVLNRAKDPDWWRRKLKTQHTRQLETLSRHFNQVNKQRGIYISALSFSHIQNRWVDNQAFLQETIATNEDGYSTSLAELSSLNVSNPAIRRAELMVRTHGFEECAKALSYSALFLTMTCPSKYHRSLSKSGCKNPNWNGATPQDGQQYLCLTFSRIRAALGHKGISVFGFRVAEPHHDGTPHWHLLLFMEPEHEAAIIDTFKNYCFEEDGNEPGAAKHRFTVERIDPDKGSATGYIAKYISKNIDGEGIDADNYGKDAKESAVRVRAWASCWGIRQFQQLGGVSVSVWRELRRLEAIKEAELEWIEEIRKTADQSNWQEFTELMGGVFCKRNEQTIRPLYQAVMDVKPQSALPNQPPLIDNPPTIPPNQQFKSNRYGDETLTRLKGVISLGVEIITRVHEWTMSHAPSSKCSSLEYCQ
ncbi:replication endonuclease [Shewanella corallii]|uniref:Replication endonuclease n=1 Tax=Shewanella corallii TaxID=560080 RepID=A0ABT0N3R7_9GAMM|nr:replication endonuclease [Shewanella corallii]MCL2913092.1 replication endonuclease [Shewanella corallii]